MSRDDGDDGGVIDHGAPNLQDTKTANPRLLSNRGPASVTSPALHS